MVIKKYVIALCCSFGLGFALQASSVEDFVASTNDLAPISLSTLKKELKTERVKWGYVRDKFGVDVYNQIGFMSKLGSLIKGAAFLEALPAAFAGGFIGSGAMFAFDIGAGSFNIDAVPKEFLVGAGTSIVFYLIAYSICRSIGGWLEAKPSVCRDVLAKFLRQWPTHEPHVPVAAKAIFEQLHRDFDEITGKFDTLDDQTARLLVENLLSTSMVLDALA